MRNWCQNCQTSSASRGDGVSRLRFAHQKSIISAVRPIFKPYAMTLTSTARGSSGHILPQQRGKPQQHRSKQQHVVVPLRVDSTRRCTCPRRRRCSSSCPRLRRLVLTFVARSHPFFLASLRSMAENAAQASPGNSKWAPHYMLRRSANSGIVSHDTWARWHEAGAVLATEALQSGDWDEFRRWIEHGAQFDKRLRAWWRSGGAEATASACVPRRPFGGGEGARLFFRSGVVAQRRRRRRRGVGVRPSSSLRGRRGRTFILSFGRGGAAARRPRAFLVAPPGAARAHAHSFNGCGCAAAVTASALRSCASLVVPSGAARAHAHSVFGRGGAAATWRLCGRVRPSSSLRGRRGRTFNLSFGRGGAAARRPRAFLVAPHTLTHSHTHTLGLLNLIKACGKLGLQSWGTIRRAGVVDAYECRRRDRVVQSASVREELEASCARVCDNCARRPAG